MAAYLARFKGSSREHAESDLRCYLSWRAERGLNPLAAQRPHLELYIRWRQAIRRFKPSAVSRRFSVAAGFYRTCVLDGVLQHSPAGYVRRPVVPAASPTLGFTHLQSEGLLTAAREPANPCGLALVSMLGLLGLRTFEAASADIADLGEEHGHPVLRVCGKGTKIVLVPLPPAAGRRPGGRLPRLMPRETVDIAELRMLPMHITMAGPANQSCLSPHSYIPTATATQPSEVGQVVNRSGIEYVSVRRGMRSSESAPPKRGTLVVVKTNGGATGGLSARSCINSLAVRLCKVSGA